MATVSNYNGAAGMKNGGVPFVNSETVPTQVTFAEAAGGTDVCEVTITLVDGDGVAVANAGMVDVWLSDAATGAGLTATTASGTVTAKSSSGVVIDTYTAKKALKVQTLATGVFVLEVTDTANTGFYVCAQNPYTGEVFVSSAVTAYGS